MINEAHLIDLNDRIAATTEEWIKETGKEIVWDLVPHWDNKEGVLTYKLDVFM